MKKMEGILVHDAWCTVFPLILCVPFFTLHFNLELDPWKRLLEWSSSVANQVVFWFLFKVALKLSTSPSRLEVSVQFIGVPEIALATKCLAEVTTSVHIRCVLVFKMLWFTSYLIIRLAICTRQEFDFFVPCNIFIRS